MRGSSRHRSRAAGGRAPTHRTRRDRRNIRGRGRLDCAAFAQIYEWALAPFDKEEKLYICDDEADPAAADYGVIRDTSGSCRRYVARRISEPRPCGDRLDRRLSRVTG